MFAKIEEHALIQKSFYSAWSVAIAAPVQPPAAAIHPKSSKLLYLVLEQSRAQRFLLLQISHPAFCSDSLVEVLGQFSRNNRIVIPVD